MSGPTVLLLSIVIMPIFLVLYVKYKIKGRVLMVILKKDKSLKFALGLLAFDFVIEEDRAYDLYPDYLRLTRYPSMMPFMFQELVPVGLWLEEDSIPLDWINLDNRKVRAMELKAALDENFFKKLVHEAVSESTGMQFNLKKAFPIILLAIGALGLGLIFMLRGGF